MFYVSLLLLLVVLFVVIVLIVRVGFSRLSQLAGNALLFGNPEV
jgi:hypothetical protein